VSRTYDKAKAEYQKASGLKPAESYPKEKIAEIDSITEGIARQKALDEQYAGLIASADKLFSAKTYDQARSEYQKASDLKPAEQYPKERIASAEKLMGDIARQKALDDEYATVIAGADRLLGEKQWEQAQSEYTKASDLKPAERYPKDKLAEITTALAALAKQKALDDQYMAAVEKADQSLQAKSYEKARTEYTAALAIKPGEKYPQERIAEIEGMIQEIKAKDEAYKGAVSRGDAFMAQKKYEEARAEFASALEIKSEESYPRNRINEINKALEDLLGKQKVFDNLITGGEQFFREREYIKARESYQQALNIFPDNAVARNRLSMTNARIDSIYRANKSLYDKSVADGDRYFNTFEFDKAIDAFTEAAAYLPMESYPKEMIAKIRRTIAENAISDVLTTPVVITADNVKEFSFTPVNIASRKNNFVYLKIKNLSGKPFNILMRYGKDKQPNGGVVIRNISADGKINERLVSVKEQDLWYREDNNWISLYPQGGDIEVSFIQVSRSK
jgi:tetratricopeptide (TPR) repeat protein